MMKTVLYILLSLLFTVQLTGCSLFSSSDGEEQETATVADGEEAGAASEDSFGAEFGEDNFESGDFDPNAMASDEETVSLGATPDADVEVEDNFGVADAYPDDGYGGEAVVDTPSSDDGLFADSSAGGEEALFADEGGVPSAPMNSNEDSDLFAQDAAPVVDTPIYTEPSFGDSYSPDPVAPSLIPVKKMKTEVYSRAGANMNRLYVVRPGDSMDSIANKIYAGGRSAEDLYSYNSHFRGKDLKVGDKVYYESPVNPGDSQMLTYYEDNNLAPQYYTTQAGDNIRKLGKSLLGHNRSWMELWATNESVESKDVLPDGVQIRYWPEGVDTQLASRPTAPPVAPAPIEEPVEVAEMNEPIAPPPSDVLPEEPMMDEPAMDEPVEVAQVDTPPIEDSMDEDFTPPPAAGTIAPPAPPRPMAPPAPPAPKMQPIMPPSNVSATPDIMDDDSMIMGALGGLLILAAVIMLIFIRRSRAKRVNFSQTQI